MNRHLIVGVDPGTTTAVAAIGLAGELIGLHSSKDMGVSQVVNYIISLGRPSLIASDVNPPPGFVADVATKFGVRLHAPDKPLQVTEKLELTRSYETGDAHQRDALAAALNAYLAYNKKLEKIEALGLPEEVKHMVLQGNSISAAKNALETAAQRTPDPEPPKESNQRQPTAQEQMIKDLQKRVKTMQEVIEERDTQIGALREELAATRRVKHTRAEKRPDEGRKIMSLQQQLHQMRKKESLLKNMVFRDLIPVGAYPQVIDGFTVLEDKPGDLSGIKTAFTSKGKVREHLLAHRITVYDSRELRTEDEIHYITQKRLLELERPPEKKADLEKIVNEYRLGRG
jgi:uncharacterized protein